VLPVMLDVDRPPGDPAPRTLRHLRTDLDGDGLTGPSSRLRTLVKLGSRPKRSRWSSTHKRHELDAIPRGKPAARRGDELHHAGVDGKLPGSLDHRLGELSADVTLISETSLFGVDPRIEVALIAPMHRVHTADAHS
jgi:hypothetical protein